MKTTEQMKKAILKKYTSRNNGREVYVNDSWTDIADVMMNIAIINSLTYDSPAYEPGYQAESYDSGSSGGYDSGGGCDCGGGCD